LKVGESPGLSRSSTQLGDWYGNTVFVGRLRLVIFISEHTMLPVVIPLRESKTIATRFQRALGDVLEALRMPPSVVRQEMDIGGEVAFGPTASRRVVGVLTELAFQAEVHLRSGNYANLLELSLKLSGVPIGGLEPAFPLDAVRMRLAPNAPKLALW
jgi:hypothetical protein